jgi:hypothetical protein
VASGLQRTGGLITGPALLLIIVVGAFSASGITFIKLMGVGMIVALLVDATVIPGAAGAGHHAAARPGQLVGAAAAGPAVRQIRDQGGNPGARAGARGRRRLTRRPGRGS